MRIVVWGTSGAYQEHWRSFVEENPCGFSFVGLVDSSPDKWGKELSGLTIYSPDSLSKLDPEVVIIASCYGGEISAEIQSQLKGKKIDILSGCSSSVFE